MSLLCGSEGGLMGPVRSRKERFAQAAEYARRHGLPPGSLMEPIPYQPPPQNFFQRTGIPITSGEVQMSPEAVLKAKRRRLKDLME